MITDTSKPTGTGLVVILGRPCIYTGRVRVYTGMCQVTEVPAELSL